MTYVIELGESLLNLRGDSRHRAVSGRIAVAVSLQARWAEINCSCGRSAAARWTLTTPDYRTLVSTAWGTGCGARTARAV